MGNDACTCTKVQANTLQVGCCSHWLTLGCAHCMDAMEETKAGALDGVQEVLRVSVVGPSAVLPCRATPDAAGYDLSSAEDAVVPPRGRKLISTGLKVSPPPGCFCQVVSRSGLAVRHHIDVGAGIIDADYQGVVHVLLINHSDGPFDVKQGDRVAQLIVQRIATPAVQEVLETDLVSAATVRGALGFGSTGV